MSTVTPTSPCRIAAIPPIRTKRTLASRKAANMTAGSNGSSATGLLSHLASASQDEPRGTGGVGQTLGGRSMEGT